MFHLPINSKFLSVVSLGVAAQFVLFGSAFAATKLTASVFAPGASLALPPVSLSISGLRQVESLSEVSAYTPPPDVTGTGLPDGTQDTGTR
ncbi:MAG: hypothetical protein F6K19_46940 [Cyanothece sp. SIO1E1]|nr:hypothetical protein [Cyanothece sp. SIO1E1]